MYVYACKLENRKPYLKPYKPCKGQEAVVLLEDGVSFDIGAWGLYRVFFEFGRDSGRIGEHVVLPMYASCVMKKDLGTHAQIPMYVHMI